MVTVHKTSINDQIEALRQLGVHTIQDLARYADTRGIRPSELLGGANV
ncbi:hypothetical protein [Arthrobacter koreensis]|nr:hypothetical protein [Arthrobacter koreensis]